MSPLHHGGVSNVTKNITLQYYTRNLQIVHAVLAAGVITDNSVSRLPSWVLRTTPARLQRGIQRSSAPKNKVQREQTTRFYQSSPVKPYLHYSKNVQVTRSRLHFTTSRWVLNMETRDRKFDTSTSGTLSRSNRQWGNKKNNLLTAFFPLTRQVIVIKWFISHTTTDPLLCFPTTTNSK